MNKELFRQNTKTKRDLFYSKISYEQQKELDRKFISHIKNSITIKQSIIIGIYISTNSEVNTEAIIQHLKKCNITVVVPCIYHNNVMAFHNNINTKSNCISHPIIPDICITPGIAFDKKMNRMGYGKGYYDKYLEKKPHIIKIGLAYKMQIYDEIPITKLDIPMDMIITDFNTLYI